MTRKREQLTEAEWHEALHGPIRIDIERALTMNRETGALTHKTVALIRELPDGPRGQGRVIWGPLQVPDKPEASWAEMLRTLAETFEQIDAEPAVPSPVEGKGTTDE